MADKDTLGLVVNILLIIGGLNWGLVAINEGWNIVKLILGGIPILERIVYALVGLAALYKIYAMFIKK